MKTKSILGGIVSGIVLGLFLKIVEQITSIKVYTLLLNVDYVPFLKEIPRFEMLEFCLHLFISILLSLLILLFFEKKDTPQRKRVLLTILFGILAGVLLYPTTTLSSRTPPLWSGNAFSLWMIGHILYGSVLGYFLKKE